VITEGSVDSTIGLHFELDSQGEFEFFYWLAAGTSYDEVVVLDRLIKDRRPQRYLDYTANYWRAWVNKSEHQLGGLPDKVVDLFKRSLLVVHSQTDSQGAILAANDHDVAERATDHYSYVWTRDGALVANSLDKAGYSYITRKFFDLCARIVHKDGYFLQKYNPDGTLASSWHACWDPWRNERLFPIQEDETALVLWALGEHYQLYRDIEFTHRLYRRLVVPCAEFMVSFRDEGTGLPKPSWNLWEDRRGIHTFTCSTVVGGLRAAANIAEAFAEHDRVEQYRKAADEVVAGMRTYLYSENDGRFLRSLLSDYEGDARPDPTVDASLFGIFYFGCFDVNDEIVSNTMRSVAERLATGGGIARFEADEYMRGKGPDAGNAWFICTLWLAEYYIAKAVNREDLSPALKLIEWVADRALPSGILSEQFDTDSEMQVSVSPLTWSHSTFVSTVLNYSAKASALG
jgi:GH15 family glucan-1,4-alpha-glucosidase